MEEKTNSNRRIEIRTYLLTGKIRKTTHSISRCLYNALQIQPQIPVQITSKSYATE